MEFPHWKFQYIIRTKVIYIWMLSVSIDVLFGMFSVEKCLKCLHKPRKCCCLALDKLQSWCSSQSVEYHFCITHWNSFSFKRYHHFSLCVDSKKLITWVKSIGKLISGCTNHKYLDIIGLNAFYNQSNGLDYLPYESHKEKRAEIPVS